MIKVSRRKKATRKGVKNRGIPQFFPPEGRFPAFFLFFRRFQPSRGAKFRHPGGNSSPHFSPHGESQGRCATARNEQCRAEPIAPTLLVPSSGTRWWEMGLQVHPVRKRGIPGDDQNRPVSSVSGPVPLFTRYTRVRGVKQRPDLPAIVRLKGTVPLFVSTKMGLSPLASQRPKQARSPRQARCARRITHRGLHSPDGQLALIAAGNSNPANHRPSRAERRGRRAIGNPAMRVFRLLVAANLARFAVERQPGRRQGCGTSLRRGNLDR
jgi:hypothetical protein